MKIKIRKNTALLILYGVLVLFIAYSTYFRNYWYPSNLFWDENFYIPAAYKYLNGQMFMSDHPPLGKLFIALGEYIFHPNTQLNTAYFLDTDHITDRPAGFSFLGVRFFPTLFATLSAIIFFLILYKLSKNPYLSFLFSSLYLFDNALIVHSRAAMLDSIQIFFIMVVLFYFLLLLQLKKVKVGNYFLIGLLIGLAVSVKLNAAILIPMFFPLYFYKQKKYTIKFLLPNFLLSFCIFLSGILLIFSGVYYLHGLLGQKITKESYIHTSDIYKQALIHKQTNNPIYAPVIIRDNLLFIHEYESGIPDYDISGSKPYTWPFGNKTINYRWESVNGHTKYLYLIGNPIIWLSGILGIMGSLLIIINEICIKRSIGNKHLFFIITVLLSLYIVYMGYLTSLHRVLYLYHYFIPLIFSLLLAVCCYLYLFNGALKRGDRLLLFCTTLFILAIVLVYYFFSPLTYYQPLTKETFLMRSWFPFWHMKPI